MLITPHMVLGDQYSPGDFRLASVSLGLREGLVDLGQRELMVYQLAGG